MSVWEMTTCSVHIKLHSLIHPNKLTLIPHEFSLIV